MAMVFLNEDEARRFVSQSPQPICFLNEDETRSFRLPGIYDTRSLDDGSEEIGQVFWTFVEFSLTLHLET